MIIANLTRKTILAKQAHVADTFISRLVGLLNRSQLNSGEALVITRSQQIHMFFMRFPIDAVFVDRQSKVIGLVHNIKPWGLSPIFWNAIRVVELPPQTIAQTHTSLGDLLEFQS